MSIDGQDEGTGIGVRRYGVKVIHEGTDLASSMLIVNVAISLGFRDNDRPAAGSGAPGNDIGTVAADARGHRITGVVEEVRRNAHRRMA